MAKYYAWLRQHGEGCDYTIGCGHALKPLKAETLVGAAEEAVDLVKDHSSPERRLEAALLLQDTGTLINVDLIYRQQEEAEKAEQGKQEEARARAEYERLRRRFGG